jgi:hypothetical protein
VNEGNPGKNTVTLGSPKIAENRSKPLHKGDLRETSGQSNVARAARKAPTVTGEMRHYLGMTDDRRQIIKDQVAEWGVNDLKNMNDVVKVELLSDEELQAYQDECDRQGFVIERFGDRGPNGGELLTISHDPEEFRRKHPL